MVLGTTGGDEEDGSVSEHELDVVAPSELTMSSTRASTPPPPDANDATRDVTVRIVEPHRPKEAFYPHRLSVLSAYPLPAESEMSTMVHVVPVRVIPTVPALGGPGPGASESGVLYTLVLAYKSIGIIYGDIGTSPLYAFTSIFGTETPPDEDNVVGALSTMLWTFMLVVVVKYLILVLIADDHGEGGSLAMYALLSRGLREKLNARHNKAYLRINTVIASLAIVATAMLLSDGLLTPSISVLSAVGGIQVAAPGFPQGAVVAISLVILLVLFLVQIFGTSKISFLFSPIMLLWFLCLLAIGIGNITLQPGVFRAFSPSYMFQYFIRNGYNGWASLGSIVLVVTGAEALYADLGHFNRPAIRTSSFVLVVPSLMITYIGQAAALIVNHNSLVAAGWDPNGNAPASQYGTVVVSNTFFNAMPFWAFYPMLIIATLASIIASQALISASYSVVNQAMKLNFSPRFTIIHTDMTHFGQIYIPEINFALMLGCLGIVAVAENANNLTAAYGVAVTIVFFITTLFYSLIIVFSFKVHVLFALVFFVVYFVIDGALLTSGLLKFTSGAWFPLLIALILSLLMLIWRWCRIRMIRNQAAMSRPDNEIFQFRRPSSVPPPSSSTASSVSTTSSSTDGGSSVSESRSLRHYLRNRQITHPLANIANTVVFCFASATERVPAAFTHFIERFPIRPQVLVFVTIASVNVPRVVENYDIRQVLACPGVYRATINYGYIERLPSSVHVVASICKRIGCVPPEVADSSDEDIIDAIDPTFILGRDRVVLSRKVNGPISAFKWVVLFIFNAELLLSRSFAASFAIPYQRTLEVGLKVPI